MNHTGPLKSAGVALEETLDNNDYRLTKQRRAIIKILEENQERHLSAEQIYKQARNRQIKMGIATIYRTLKLLEDLKLVKKLEAGDKALYELNLSKFNHIHFICLGCGKIIETKRIDLEDCKEFLQENQDFKILDCSIRLFGYCSDCQEKRK